MRMMGLRPGVVRQKSIVKGERMMFDVRWNRQINPE
jgi:hypothetical protein